ncbi:MAG: TetR/AcrR family transcriptional regulator [Spirochaetia bacterium]|jgi:AcrR family transcriptional regulator
MPVKDHYHHGALKETLLAEALHDLETEGLEGVSLRRLAESAGVSKTAPYRHFADKRELLVAIAADGFRLLAEKLESAPQGETGDALEGIRSLFRAYMDFARDRPALYRLMISRLGFELHSEACRLNSERALGCLIRAVQAAQASGWRPEKESMALVLSLWASVHGWATLLIDGLLPPGFAVKGDDWLGFAQVLLDDNRGRP